MRLLRWAGALVGVPVVAAAYRRIASRRADEGELCFVVRTTVEPELVNDLVDLVRKVRGRAALKGANSFSVPVPRGIEEAAAYRELRAVLESWELRHPGVRAEIVNGRPTTERPRRSLTRSAGTDSINQAAM